MQFKLPALLAVLLFQSLIIFAGPSDEFITIWQTDNAGESNTNEVRFFGTGNGYTIIWEEVANEIANNGTLVAGTIASGGYQLISFPSPGTYRVRVDPTTSGTFTEFKQMNDKQKLTEVAQWGTTAWSGFYQAFGSCPNMDVTATDAPDLSAATNLSQMFAFCYSLVGNGVFNTWQTGTITDMSGMFWSASLFNQPLSNWNTENVVNMFNMFENADAFNADITTWNTGSVTNMGSMFRSADIFNQSIGAWNTSSVTSMVDMFREATSFNQPLNSWNVSSVTSMAGMFNGAALFNQPLDNWVTSSATNMTSMFEASAFNQPIGNWDVSAVTSMAGLFKGATLFNQPLDNWVTSSATNMTSMFEASAFNQPISNWDVSAVTVMNGMFYHTSGFNQDLSAWNLSSISSMSWMFENCGMDCINYSLMLNGWAANVTTPDNITLGAIGMVYDATALAAHTTLTTTKGWTIDDVYDEDCGIALPVALHAFEGIYKAPYAVLSWKSAVESGLDHYVVEKSADGKHFQKIAQVSATGSGSVYSINEIQREARVFYRLKMVDMDGKFSYSTTQLVMNTNNAYAALTLYPNPVRNGQLHIELANAGKVSIVTPLGQEVMVLTLPAGVQIVDVHTLANGTYWIRQGAITQRLVIAQ